MCNPVDLTYYALLILHSSPNTLPYWENAKQLYEGSGWTGKVN